MTVLGAPLDGLSREARPYPADMLNGCDTGLCLFAAAFLGVNDAIHFARHNIQTVCVDLNAERIGQMETIYPQDWEFLVDDAWAFAGAITGAYTFDAVSVDSFLGDATDRSLTTLELWCSLASKCVTVTIPAGASPAAPAGWKSYEFPRSTRASWLVLQRD